VIEGIELLRTVSHDALFMGSTMASPFDIPDISPEEAAITEQYLDDYIAGKIPRYANRLRLEDDDWEQVCP
jgi:hypothetical protein